MEVDGKKDLKEKLINSEDAYIDHKSHLHDQEDMRSRCYGTTLDNKTVLKVVFCLFVCFASAEMTGALIGNSIALLGDASASCTDVITYAMNLYAETIVTPKSPLHTLEEGSNSPVTSITPSAAESAILDERTRLLHEVYVPTFSLVTLIIVTLVILSLAVLEIASGGDEKTDVTIMFAFASVNTVIDIICISMFYYRKEEILHNKYPSATGISGVKKAVTPTANDNAGVNINMFSALTHIGSDTLRTIAIFGSAIVAISTGVKSSLCDAWAALIVSVTIFIAIIPLSMEVYSAYCGKRAEGVRAPAH